MFRVQGMESRIVFLRGAPAKARVPWPLPFLGDVLLRMGAIDPSTRDQSLAEARHANLLHGQVLLRRGHVDRDTLEEALREQLTQRVLELFRRHDAASTFALQLKTDGLADWGGDPTPVDPRYLVWHGSSERAADPQVQATLSVLGDTPVVVSRDADLTRFGFGAAEMSVASWLQAHPTTVHGLVGKEWLSPDRTKALLYVLFLTRSLAFREATAAPDPRQHRAAPSSGTMSRVADQNGCEEDAQEPKSERMEGLKASVRRIYRETTAPEQSPEQVESRADPDRLLQEARRARRAGDMARAEEQARAAYEARRTDPEIRAELALIVALTPERREAGDLSESLDLVRSVLHEYPDSDSGHYVRGMVHQALGWHDQAYEDLKKAVRLNPRNGEAVAALRVYVKRHRETGTLEPQPESRSRSGLGAALSRLFKG